MSLRSTLPLTTADPVRRMMNDFFTDFDTDPFFNTSWATTPSTWGITDRPRLMSSRSGLVGCLRMDAYETDTGFHVHCECAGIPKERIDCSVENNVLTIKVRKEAPADMDDSNMRCRERCFGSCQRSISLPNNVDIGAVQCCNKDGVLCVDFPKLGGQVAAKKLAIE